MKVRCPACRTVCVDPPPRFSCAGCSRTLSWQAPPLWRPEQLTLFQSKGTAEPLLLPLERPDPVLPIADRPVQGDVRQLIVDSVALITAYLSLAQGADDVVPALLGDQTSEQALALAATTAWLASVLVVEVDSSFDGAGTAWLQGVALGMAGGA